MLDDFESPRRLVTNGLFAQVNYADLAGEGGEGGTAAAAPKVSVSFQRKRAHLAAPYPAAGKWRTKQYG